MDELNQLQCSSRRDLETLALGFVASLSESTVHGRVPVLSLKSRSIPLRAARATASGTSSLKSLTMITKVMSILHQKLSASPTAPTWMTRRDVYYQDPDLFGSQQAVDGIISLLVDSFPAPQPNSTDDFHLKDSSHLGVIASPRGVVHGPVKIHMHGPGGISVLDAGVSGSMGVLLPPGSRIAHVEVDCDVQWILVVEKDATFQQMVLSELCTKACQKGIMVTSKGFPDLATRQFLCRLSAQIPTYILADGDPFGAHIYWVYRQAILYGNLCANTAAKKIAYIGVHLSDLKNYGIDNSTVSMPLLSIDVKRIVYLLQNPDARSDYTLCRSLQIMLHTHTKIEIQALSNKLCSFLVDKLPININKTLGEH